MQQNWKLDIGDFIAERQNDGTFIYKAKSSETPLILSNKRKNNTKDKPLYPIVEEIEIDMKRQCSKMIDTSIKKIEDYLLNLER